MENKLTAKQQLFVDYYLVDLNATQAAKKAGYSVNNADKIGSELLGKTRVKAAVQEAMDKRAERVKVDADYVLTTIVETMERCKQAKPVYDKKGEHMIVETPDGGEALAYTFDAGAVLRGAELLGKHLKLFTDKVEHSGDMQVTILTGLPVSNDDE